MQGMDNDSEPQDAKAYNPRFMMNEKPNPDQAAHNFATAVVQSGILMYCIHNDTIYRQVTYAWKSGYCFGNNEMMDKWQQYIACQPPPPIVMDKKEISLSTYKMFVREKIKRDSKGSWWAKVKLWYQFLTA